MQLDYCCIGLYIGSNVQGRLFIPLYEFQICVLVNRHCLRRSILNYHKVKPGLICDINISIRSRLSKLSVFYILMSESENTYLCFHMHILQVRNQAFRWLQKQVECIFIEPLENQRTISKRVFSKKWCTISLQVNET